MTKTCEKKVRHVVRADCTCTGEVLLRIDSVLIIIGRDEAVELVKQLLSQCPELGGDSHGQIRGVQDN